MKMLYHFGIIIFLLLTHFLRAQDYRAITSAQWKEDINFAIETIEREHPNPYWRNSRSDFQDKADELISELEHLTDVEIKVRLIQLVASLQDGHTDVSPYGKVGFKSIFPIRFYQFSDGVYITAVSRDFAELAGAQVLKVDTSDINGVLDLTSTLWNNENDFRKLEGGVFYLSSPDALKTLDIIKNTDNLPLTVKLKSGEIKEFNISKVDEGFDLSFVYWGEIWGPGSIEYITGIDELAPGAYYNQNNSALPLHLRYRSTFWFTYLDEENILYLQLNGLGDSRRESFATFLERLWSVADTKVVDKFILDIRYNVGGDGSRVNELVHGFIKRDHINLSSKLFTVLGRATFSAGVNLASAMREHTQTTFIGTPAGAYFNHNGDASTFLLPNSEMELGVSTIWHQPVSSRDKSQLICIDIPIEMSSEDYFNKQDPILNFIRDNNYADLRDIVFNRGAAEGIATYKMRVLAFQQISWWCDLTESDWNQLGYDLKEQGKVADALIIFRYTTELFPNSWKACDSLAELYSEMGNKKESIFWYQKALQNDPLNFNAHFQKEMIDKQSQ
jgi:tetratricopeptide (TPR) repeat protein